MLHGIMFLQLCMCVHSAVHVGCVKGVLLASYFPASMQLMLVHDASEL